MAPAAGDRTAAAARSAGRGATVGDVIRQALAASVARLLEHDPVVRLGNDAEAVHQARVATRRLRSDLRSFRRFVAPDWATSLRDDLRVLGARLGAVRDADVLLARLERDADRLPADEHLAAEAVLARLVARREEERVELAVALRSPAHHELLERLVDAARRPALLPGAETRGRDALAGVVRGPWRRLRSAAASLGDDPSEEALHAVRIHAKRCRYATEAVVPVFGKRARSFAAALAGLQEVLGEHQDAVVARRWLAKEAATLPPDAAFAAGMLAGLEVAAATAAREAFPAAWRAVLGVRPRRWS